MEHFSHRRLRRPHYRRRRYVHRGRHRERRQGNPLALATLLDLAAQGLAILLLNNTEKTGTNVRGRGDWADKASVHYEVRDMTSIVPSGKKHWSDEIPP